MKNFLVKWIINSAALMLTANMLDGIYVTGWGAVFVAALILGIVNAVIRPIFLLLTLPLNILTLGLFTFVVNGIMLKLVSGVVGGLEIVGMWPSIIGAIVLTVVSSVLSWMVE